MGTHLWRKKNHNGVFVACGGTVQIGYSDDGKTWNAGVHVDGGLPFGDGGRGTIAEKGNGIWVSVGTAAGDRTRDILWSDDQGKTWNDSTGEQFVSGAGTELVYGNGTWVAGGRPNVSDSNMVLYSRDGENWSSVNDQPLGTGAGSVTSLKYLNGKFFLGGKGGTGSVVKIWSSSDGIDWTAASGSPFGTSINNNPTNFAYGNGIYVSVGITDEDNVSTLWFSTDGQTWSVPSSKPVGNSVTVWDVKYYNGIFVSGGDAFETEPILIWSTDGDKWNAATGIGTTAAGYLIQNLLIPDKRNGRWFAGGGTGSEGLLLYSDDGKDWTRVKGTVFPGGASQSSTSGWDGRINDSNQISITTGFATTDDNIYYSHDRVNWIGSDSIFGSGTGNKISHVSYG